MKSQVKRFVPVVLAGCVALLLISPLAAAGTASRGLSVTVYEDGYVHIRQTFSVDSKATSVQLPLLSAVVSDLVASDQAGSPLSYGFAPGGNNLTVYTLGASAVSLTYDTSSLTTKNGTVWTLSFSAGYNSTVILPALSTLTSTSGTPYSINVTSTSPELTLPPGAWKIGYGVPFVGVTLTTGTSSSPGPVSVLLGSGQLEEALVVAAAAAVVGTTYVLWRGRRMIPHKGDLRPDDVQVLNFIREKGGKVLELEIRTRFALPKTSAWRQIKRLERMGYVRVAKAGSQNQIELLKDRDALG